MRSAASSEALGQSLRIEHVIKGTPRKQTWEDPLNADVMAFDRVLEPIIFGNQLFVGFKSSQSVIWKPAAWAKADERAESQRTPNIAPLIKEVIQHPEWKPGNAVAILIRGKGKRVATAFGGKEVAAQLFVDSDEIRIEPDPNVALSPYRVKLFFGLPKSVGGSTRHFSVSANGNQSSTEVKLDPPKENELVRTMDRVMLGDVLDLSFKPIAGLPILSGVELTKLDE